MPWGSSVLRRQPNTIMASGMVLSTPTATSAQPTPFRRSPLNLSAARSPMPAPSNPRVPASRPSSGNASSTFVMPKVVQVSCLRRRLALVALRIEPPLGDDALVPVDLEVHRAARVEHQLLLA